MSDESDIKYRDMQTLAGIVKGQGYYASPSPERIKRMTEKGLIKRVRGILRPTLKGRIIARLSRYGLFR